MKFKGKLMNQTSENGKKTNFGPNIGLFGPNLVINFFFVGFTSIRCYTLLQVIIVYNFKEN